MNKNLLKRFSVLCNALEKRVFFTTFGGFAVDGYVGRFTREHKDVDLFCFRKDIETIKDIFSRLSYKYEEVEHPQEKNYIYKIKTLNKDGSFTFHILDKKGEKDFEVSFYNFPHLVYPISFIKPRIWVDLEGLRFPVIGKDFLIKLKEKEANFFEKERKEKPEKYTQKHKEAHKKALNDLALLLNKFKHAVKNC